jgi:hypothetical protein
MSAPTGFPAQQRDVVVSARHLWKVYGRGESAARAALERGDPFDGGGIGLRDVSLEVHRGELLVVIGLSGFEEVDAHPLLEWAGGVDRGNRCACSTPIFPESQAASCGPCACASA